jgi:hypothetical protein
LFVRDISCQLSSSLRKRHGLEKYRNPLNSGHRLSSISPDRCVDNAGSLAACQGFTICTLIKLHSNTRISLKATSLDQIKFLAALQRVEFDFDLPFKSATILFTFYLVLQLPALLWTGAITPEITQVNDRPASLAIPH